LAEAVVVDQETVVLVVAVLMVVLAAAQGDLSKLAIFQLPAEQIIQLLSEQVAWAEVVQVVLAG